MFNTIQKIIRKKRQTLFIVGILLCAAPFTLIVLRAFFRPVRYVVHIDDALFEKYVLPLPEKAEQTENPKLPFTFKKLSETAKQYVFFT